MCPSWRKKILKNKKKEHTHTHKQILRDENKTDHSSSEHTTGRKKRNNNLWIRSEVEAKQSTEEAEEEEEH